MISYTISHPSPVMPRSDFRVSITFYEAMKPSVTPVVTLTSTGSQNPVVSGTGTWSSQNFTNDTYTTPTITLSAAMAGTITIHVRQAQDVASNAMIANDNVGTFLLDATAPANPILNSLNCSVLKFIAAWEANPESNIAGYSLAYGLASRSYSNTIDAGNVLAKTVTDVSASVYYVAVRAYNQAGIFSDYSNEKSCLVLSDNVPPAAVSGLTAISGDQRVELTWNANSETDIDHYNVYMQLEPLSDVTNITPIAQTSLTGQLVDGLTNDISFWFAVVAVDKESNMNPLVTAIRATPHAPNLAGTVAYWKLNSSSGTTAIDSSGNEFHGSLANGVSWSDSVACLTNCDGSDHSAAFDGGSASRISGVMNIPLTNQVSLEAWFKGPTQSSATNIRIIEVSRSGTSSPAPSTTSHAIAILPNGSLQAWVTCVSGSRQGEILTAPSTFDQNIWYHAVYTYDGAIGRLYINGGEQFRQSGSCSDLEDGKFFVLGNHYLQGSGFQGNEDEVVVYNRALRQDEIAKRYGDSINGPLAFWNFNDGIGDQVTDSAGRNFHGVRGGTKGQWVESNIDTDFENYLQNGWAMQFNGSGDYVTMGNNALNMLGSDFTIEAWLKKTSSATSAMSIITKGMTPNASPPNNGYSLRLQNAQLEFAVYGDTTAITVATPAPADNEWHQIVAVFRNGQNLQLYVDSILQATEIFTTPLSSLITSAPLTIGAMDDGAGTVSEYFTGILDDIRIFSRAFSEEEVMRHYWLFSWGNIGRWKFNEISGTAIYDSSKLGHHGTVQGTLSRNDSDLGELKQGASTGQTLIFDGSTTNVVIPGNVPSLRTYYVTLEAWINPTASSGLRRAILSRENEWIMQLGNETGQGENHLEVAIKPGFVFYDGGSLPLNQWSHVMAVWDGITVRTFINGVKTHTYSASPGWIEPTAKDIIIGNRADQAAYFQGKIEDVAVYNRPLGDGEVAHRARFISMTGLPVPLLSTPDSDGNYSVGNDILFDGSGSYDPNYSGSGNGIVSYIWDFGQGEKKIVSTSPQINWHYSTAGTYLINLTVQDNNSGQHGIGRLIKVQ
jgi:hypothetical protein